MKITTQITNYENHLNSTSIQSNLTGMLFNSSLTNTISRINDELSINNYQTSPINDNYASIDGLSKRNKDLIGLGVLSFIALCILFTVVMHTLKNLEKEQCPSSKGSNSHKNKKFNNRSSRKCFFLTEDKKSTEENIALTRLNTRPRAITRSAKAKILPQNKIQLQTITEAHEETDKISPIIERMAPIAEVEDSSDAAFSKPKSKIEDTNTKELKQSKSKIRLAEVTVHQTDTTTNISANNSLGVG